MVKGRRENGEGWIKEQEDGTYRLSIKPPGKPRIYRRAKTRAEAREKLRELQRRIEDGRLLTTSAQPLGQYLDHWLSVVSSEVRSTTYRVYLFGALKAADQMGEIKLRDLKPMAVQSMYGALAKTYSQSTVHLVHRVLTIALRQAVSWELLDENPMERVTAPKVERIERPVLDDEQVAELLDSTRGTRWFGLWSVLATTGLRVGEATGLRWEDIDWDAPSISVRRTLVHLDDGTFEFHPPKSDRSRRTVYVLPEVIEAFRAHQQIQRKERMRCLNWQEGGLVFCTTKGTPMQNASVWQAWQVVCKRLGFPKMRPHDLRHTVATGMLESGEWLNAVQEFLGHSSPSITAGIYGHVRPGSQRGMAERLGGRMEQARKKRDQEMASV